MVGVSAATNCNVAGLYPTATTCSSFKTGATRLTEVCYSVKSGFVSNVTPGVFFYYAYVTAPSSSFTVDVTQTSLTTGFKLFGVQISSNQSQVFLWDPSCNKVATGTQVTLGQARVSISNATAGRIYVLSVKYDAKSVLNSPVGSVPPIANYNFTMKVNSTVVTGSSINLQAKPSNCVVVRMADSETVEAGTLLAYPNPTAGDVRVNYEMLEAGKATFMLYDLTGKMVMFREEQHDDAGQYQLELKLTDKYLSNGLYFLRVIRNDRADELRILLTE